MQYTTEDESDVELISGAPLHLIRQDSYVDIKLLREQQMKRLGQETWIQERLTVWVFGASGDLAKKKTYPSLFALYEGGMLPPSNKVQIVGYARSALALRDFRNKLEPYLLGKNANETRKQNAKKFLEMCTYFTGQYDSAEDAARVAKAIYKLHGKPENSEAENRLFYLALPPTQFVSASQMIKDGAMSQTGFNRIVVEKPFGRDTDTAKKLGQDMAKIFSEDYLYRIDHYLGKEMVQNIIVLRFANAWLEPTWNRNHISAVQISFKEDIGTKGRGGYFDSFGIIRDVIQNHLMQVMSIAAMEAPVRVAHGDYANFVRDEKVKVLRAVRKLRMEDVVIGQYTGNTTLNEPGYLEDDTVPQGSNCPTFATCVLYIDNARWQGVPFIIKAGKALDDRRAEIRVQYRAPAAAAAMFGCDLPPNELVLRLQPNEAVYMKTNVKRPGLGTDPVQTELELNYDHRYPMQELQDAYTRLLLDVLRGKQATFVRDDELMAAWEIFTPVLHEIESGAMKPIPYVFGTRGPKESDELIQRVGFTYNSEYAQGYREAKEFHTSEQQRRSGGKM